MGCSIVSGTLTPSLCSLLEHSGCHVDGGLKGVKNVQAPCDLLRKQLPAPPPFEPAQQLLWLFLFFFFFPFDVDPLKSLLNLLQYCSCFMFCFFGHKAYEILTPQSGIEFATLCTGRRSLNHWTAREVCLWLFFPSADHQCPRAKSDLSSYSSWALSSLSPQI